MSDDPDFEYLIVDSTIVRAHQHAAGAKKRGLKIRRSLARSRGGLSTKIHLAVRGLGCPVRFTLTAGQKGDAPQAAALIEGLPAEVVMADTAYDADHLRQAIAAKGALAVIPNNPSRALKYPLDKHLYAQRHLVECAQAISPHRNPLRKDRPNSGLSSLSRPSSYGCDKCPHHLGLRRRRIHQRHILYFRYQMVAFSYRGSEPAAQHRTLLDSALKRDAATATATLRAHVNNCVEHALATAALR